MPLLTNDKLQAMFQQSRERKQKEREQHKKARQQQYRDLCKETDSLLKEALQDEKRKRMEQLKALAEKCRQKPLKCTVTELYISGNRYIERNNDWMHLYKTRQELMEAEERGEGKINWTVWDRLITEFRNNLL